MSAEIERRPFKMSVMRPDGTPKSSASRFALTPRALSSLLSRRPGCATGRCSSAPVIIDDLDIVSVTFVKLEANAPSCIDRHGPLPPAIAFQPVKADAFERANVVKRLRDIQSEEQVDCVLEIQATELGWPLSIPNLTARGIAP